MSKAEEAFPSHDPYLAPPDLEQLPSYEDSNNSSSLSSISTASKPVYAPRSPSSKNVLPPTTLHIKGRFIHPPDPNAPPLYELSHVVRFLKDSDRTVRLERLDQQLQHANTASPQVTTRSRHIYDLKHPTAITASTFTYHGEPVSRKASCWFGVKSTRVQRLGHSSGRRYEVCRAVVASSSDRKLQEKELLFEADPPAMSGSGAEGGDVVVYEWRDGDGVMLAREVSSGGGSGDVEGEGVKLVMSGEMEQMDRDLLVAAWMTRTWWELAKRHEGGLNPLKRVSDAVRAAQNSDIAGFSLYKT